MGTGLGDYVVVSIILTYVTSFVLKAVIRLITDMPEQKIDLIRDGGIPSSHTTLVTALTTSLYIKNGWSDVVLVSLIFSIVVIWDAMHVRLEVETISRFLNRRFREHFQENVGHTPFEVLAGLALGISMPVLLFYFAYR
ncbi:hypothetical protein COY95_02405 [Candidatus Woesearchaeota archaeon CG_4_10_14_0_8_um_filter_47_5]|nr:MAG: hypothetical protein COY95_02405 [Candidatus Woesearchaeota archaeon CG_4_10_14_0_8_um_filter_47_5]